MSETLELVRNIEANEEVVMKIYDMCNDKKEYKAFLNFCKDAGKEFKALSKDKDTAIYRIKKIGINDNTYVSSTIMNFKPESYKDGITPLEISITIGDKSKNNITSYGSAMFGGCNEAEYNEFIGIITSGYSDFTKEF